MTFKTISDFFDTDNKYKYFYNTVDAVTILLLGLVFINQYYTFINEKTLTSFSSLAQKVDGICIWVLLIIIVLKMCLNIILYKFYDQNTKIMIFTIKDLCNIFIKLLIIVVLLSLLIVSLNVKNLIFFFFVVLYYLIILIKGIYKFNHDSFSSLSIGIPYFDYNDKRLSINDYVIYHRCLYQILECREEYNNEITYYLFKQLKGCTSISKITLEDALKDEAGKLTFYCHDYN